MRFVYRSCLIYYTIYLFFFFFQAEDGIRDYKVTGVQTCALPISSGTAGTTRTTHAVTPLHRSSGSRGARGASGSPRVQAGSSRSAGGATRRTDRKSVV